MGIVHAKRPSGVFLAVEMPSCMAELLIEHLVPLDQHRNYQSFFDAQQEAQDDLDRVIRGKCSK